MVFIRAKQIKGKDYYYLVKSTRRGGKVNQINLEYLGPAFPSPAKIVKLKKKYKRTKNAKN